MTTIRIINSNINSIMEQRVIYLIIPIIPLSIKRMEKQPSIVIINIFIILFNIVDCFGSKANINQFFYPEKFSG